MITRQSILIVDDTPANLRLLAGILANREYMVRPVPDGALALSAAQAEPPDLILLDVMMPRMSGYEVCQQLKADERTRQIPVIFISAKHEILDKVQAFALGAVDYITKPFQAEEVLARVETHLTLRNLQKRLEAQNVTLSETLQQLKATQDELIHREKMAALGHLIAGIAHEINTPLGAIQASISNIVNAMHAAFQEFPHLLQQLAPERQREFFALIQTALENKEHLSSREARTARRALQEELAAQGLPSAETLTNLLVNMGIYRDVTPFLSLLRDPRNIGILQNSYYFFMVQNNSRNIMLAVERAAKVVFALKSYTHYDSSGRKVQTNVPEGLELILTLYYNPLKKGVTVLKDYQEVPLILGYPDELNQVWSNLIQNAIHAMQGQGQLEIQVTPAPARPPAPNLEEGGGGGRAAGEFIVVRITDSGQGIPAEIQPRIFDPFFTTKAAGEGSGLGLHIVRRIIDRHQGRIEFVSHPGRTTFSVFLPVAMGS